jgi:hypothetical protein
MEARLHMMEPASLAASYAAGRVPSRLRFCEINELEKLGKNKNGRTC